MTLRGLSVVQFVHPGFEYHKKEHVGLKKQTSGVMTWKRGNSIHDRKFMWTFGSALDPTSGEHIHDTPLTLWGEWEGPSVFWKIGRTADGLPGIIHSPFRPRGCPTSSVQNTDPLVFGDTFVYSNCRQPRHSVLRALPSGSLILFGRLANPTTRPSFSLDTCLVVGDVRQLPTIPLRPEVYGHGLLEDAVMGALYSEGFQTDFGVHFGLTPADSPVFSFFPAKVSQSEPAVFSRPELRPMNALENVISPGTQATKMTHGLSKDERDAIWKEVVRQVAGHGCVLGYQANPPPFLAYAEAGALSGGAPAGLPLRR